MFDAAAAAVETLVVDDPDAEAAPAIGRVTTAELTMQILFMGQWHRQTPDLAESACGVPVRLVETPKRRECLTFREYLGAPAAEMCPLCFTGHEIRRAIENDLRATRAEQAALQQWIDEAPKRAAELEDRTAALVAKRRHTTHGGTVPLKKPTRGDR